MALCNQTEAFTSDLGDDQSRYLYHKVRLTDNKDTWRKKTWRRPS